MKITKETLNWFFKKNLAIFFTCTASDKDVGQIGAASKRGEESPGVKSLSASASACYMLILATY